MKKLQNNPISFLLLLLIVSCGVPEEDFQKVTNENGALNKEIESLTQQIKKLKTDLDFCQNGEDKLIARILKNYDEGKYKDAKTDINLLSERFPESSKNSEFKKLLGKIEVKEEELRKKLEAEEKERIRLANLDNTGMWRINYYVDEFGEATKEGYITNTSLIKGKFSNTATEDAKLDVRFLISNSRDISIKLFEYAKKNPVKSISTNSYRVLIQDKDGNRLKLRAINYSDRLSFDKSDSNKVHKTLMKGGNIKFKIIESRYENTIYDFSILNADWYENAYEKLKSS